MSSVDFEKERHRMVDVQLHERGIHDERLLGAFRKVPREAFLPGDLRPFAYEDRPLKLDDERFMAPAHTTAVMLQALSVAALDRALDTGSASGYEAALLGELAGRVTSVHCDPSHSAKARMTLHDQGYDAVQVFVRDATRGFPRKAPFDAILVSGAAPDVPEPLLEQLESGGRLVMAIGPRDEQQTLYRFHLEGYELHRDELGSVRLSPLFGRHGYAHDRKIPW